MKHLKLFFALFAMLALGVTNAWGETATLSISSGVTSNGTLTDGGGGSWSLTSDGSYTSNKAYIQVGTNKKDVSYLKLSTSFYSSKKIEKIQVWGTSKANTKVTIKVYIGGNKLGESSVFTSQTADAGGTEFAVENTNDYTGDILIEISRPSCTTGAIYFNKAVITYYEAGETPDVKTLKSIAVEGMTTNYETGDIFKFDGTCTATYSVTKNDVAQEDETKVVTPTSVSTPDLSTVGEKAVTVTYTEDEVTVTAIYTINVTENVITAGEYELALNNTFFGCGTGNNATEQVKKSNDILVTAGCLSSASSKTYYDAGHVRFYADSYLKLSVPEGYVINSIVFTAGGDWKGSISVNAGTYTNDTKSWAGSAQEVVFSFGAQNRIATATVTYAAAGDTPETPDTPEEPETPVVPENLGAKTIAEFLALKNTTDTCVLTGVVANIANTTYGNFDLVDATGSVYVYGLLTAAGESKQFASMDIAAGDTLTVKAIYNEYNSKPQAKNAIYVSHTKTATPVVPENLGAKTIAEFLALKNTTDTCVLTGVVANIANTEYGNFDLVDATGSVYVYGLLTAAGVSKQFASMDIAAGDTLTVKAIYNEFNSNPQAKNAIYVSHSKLVLTVKVTSENGTVDGLADGGKYVRGTEVILTATAAEGYEFVNWTVGEEVVSTENPYTFTVTADVALVANFKAVEPETITWELNGGELPTPAVPTNEELWIAFMPYYQEYYDVVRAEQPIASVAVFLSAGMGDDATIFTSEDSDYKWLGDYIIKVTTEQSAALTNLANWKFNAQAFFNAYQYTAWPKSADFTEAGKPENWGPAYQAANALVLPTEPVAEDYVLPTPTKEGYTFVGWYDNAAGAGDAYTVIPAGWSGTLYAIWKQGTTTALENIAVEGKAVKAIVNGQLIIIKNGVQYNAQGQVVK